MSTILNILSLIGKNVAKNHEVQDFLKNLNTVTQPIQKDFKSAFNQYMQQQNQAKTNTTINLSELRNLFTENKPAIPYDEYLPEVPTPSQVGKGLLSILNLPTQIGTGAITSLKGALNLPVTTSSTPDKYNKDILSSLGLIKNQPILLKDILSRNEQISMPQKTDLINRAKTRFVTGFTGKESISKNPYISEPASMLAGLAVLNSPRLVSYASEKLLPSVLEKFLLEKKLIPIEQLKASQVGAPGSTQEATDFLKTLTGAERKAYLIGDKKAIIKVKRNLIEDIKSFSNQIINDSKVFNNMKGSLESELIRYSPNELQQFLTNVKSTAAFIKIPLIKQEQGLTKIQQELPIPQLSLPKPIPQLSLPKPKKLIQKENRIFKALNPKINVLPKNLKPIRLFENISKTATTQTVTNEQQALINILKSDLKLGPIQLKKLAKSYTGIDTIQDITKPEASDFIKILQQIKPGKLGKPYSIPKTKALITQEQALKTYNEIGVGSQIQSPERVFKRIGATQEIANPVVTVLEKMRDNIANKETLVRKWQDTVGAKKRFNKKNNKLQSRRIFDAINDPQNAQLIPKQKELQVIDDIKSLLNDYADKLDESLIKQGLPIINRKTNYITNLIQEDVKLAIKEKKPIDSSLLAILDQITPKQIYDPFLQRRTGGMPIQRDIWKALNAYISMTEKKLALDPVLKQIAPFIKLLPPNAQKYTKWWISNILGRPAELDRLVDATLNSFLSVLGKKKISIPADFKKGLNEMELEIQRFSVNKAATKSVDTLKKYNYFSFIASNFRTMIVNLTQPVGSIANQPGIIKPIINQSYGYLKVFQNIFTQKGWDKMKELGILTDVKKVIDSEMSVDKGSLGDLLMWNMKLSEFVNRVSTTYAGKKSYTNLLKKEGINLTEQEGIALGREFSNMVNFKYNIEQKPKLFSNPIGSLYYQYSSFALKHAELLEQMAKNLGNKNLVPDFVNAARNGKAVEFLRNQGAPVRTSLLKYILYAAVTSTAFSLIGINFWEMFFKGFIPNQFTKIPELLSAIAQSDYYLIKQAVGDILTPPSLSKGLKGLIPLQTQGKRIVRATSLSQLLGLTPLQK